MDKDFDSIKCLHDFLEFHELKNGNHYITFSSNVTYEFDGRLIPDKLDVSASLDAWTGGNIEIADGAIINAEFVHTGFTPEYQIYSFNSKTKALIIKGISDKMRGPYKVSIIPDL